jgi:hypothetical protein
MVQWQPQHPDCVEQPAMSDDSSDNYKSLTVVIVLAVMLVLMCAIVPIGVGTMMYFRLEQSAQQAEAARRQALLGEQEARMQAELARAEAARALAERMANPAAIPALPAVSAPTPGELTVEQRKTIYVALKQLNDGLAALEAAAKDDPAFGDLLTAMKSQREAALEQAAKGAGITRQKLDEIMAEGEREKW